MTTAGRRKLGKMGVEIELLAPPGRSRRDLAEAIADRSGVTNVRRFFHPQAEPSKAPNTPFFENLTLGFSVEDDQGNVLARCVDDLTLQDDLDRQRQPRPGWYRIVSDDTRLLELIMLQTDATAPLNEVLLPIARLFGTELQQDGGMVRVADRTGSPVAIGAPLPGERERPCELITPPIETDHFKRLEELLEPARSLGFTIPAEGAIHLHFDATPLCGAPTFANLVRFLRVHGDELKRRMKTNPRCRRMGEWPETLLEIVRSEGFVDLEWDVAREKLSRLKLTKYCDFNLRNFIHHVPDKFTFEVRILPVWLDTRKILEAAALFAAILDWASENGGGLKPIPEDLDRFAVT